MYEGPGTGDMESGSGARMRRGISATLGVLLVCGLALLILLGCGPEDGAAGDVPSVTTTPTAREAPSAEPPNVAEAAADGIDESSIRTHLAHLTGAVSLEGGEVTIDERGSAEGRRAAAEYLEESFEAMGLPARTLEFSLDGRRGYNVEATLRGSGGGKHLGVTAHLDSTYNPGANDNASGLVSILMTAKALQRLDLDHTVHFVAYDLEEIGAIGSSRYVESVVGDLLERKGGSAIIGNLNNDMVGYDKSGSEAVMGACNQAGPLDDALLRAAEIIESPINLSEVCLGRSDHQNFWDAGLPAMVLTDGSMYDGYPWYHEPGDTIDKLDLAYLRSMIRLTAAAAALLAAPEGEV